MNAYKSTNPCPMFVHNGWTNYETWKYGSNLLSSDELLNFWILRAKQYQFLDNAALLLAEDLKNDAELTDQWGILEIIERINFIEIALELLLLHKAELNCSNYQVYH